MAFEIAGLAAKFGPTVLAAIMDGAIRLYQGAQKAEPDMIVPSMTIADGSQLDPSKIPVAIKDIERSLLTLNGQVTEASLLITKLAESNAALAGEIQKQRAWLYLVSTIAGASVALSIVVTVLSAM